MDYIMANDGKGAATLLAFFGKLPGQTITQFHAEVKALSNDDRDELVALARVELDG